MSEHVERIMAELERIGAEGIRYEPRSGHGRVYFTARGREQFYVVPSSASDRRAHLNAISDVRRMCGWKPPAKKPKARKRKVRRERPVQEPVSMTPGRDGLSDLRFVRAELVGREKFGELWPEICATSRRIADRAEEACARIRRFAA